MVCRDVLPFTFVEWDVKIPTLPRLCQGCINLNHRPQFDSEGLNFSISFVFSEQFLQ
ncbi:hypothetical protein ACSBR2_030543 [Camellia fascicularis]